MSDQQLTNLILRAEALMKSNWVHGLQLLEDAVREHPEDPRPYLSLAEFFTKRQLFKQAIKNLLTASKLLPNDANIKYMLGNCYFATGEYRMAIIYYDMVADPWVDIQYNKALALAYLGESSQSITQIKTLLNKVDNLPFIYFLLIEQLLYNSEFKEAQFYIRQAESKVGKHGHLLFLKAVVYAQDQMWLQAYHAFSEADKIKALKDGRHIFTYALSAMHSGLEDKAIELILRAIEIEPRNSGYYEEALRLLVKGKRFQEAYELFKKAEKHIKRFTPILNLLKARIHEEEP